MSPAAGKTTAIVNPMASSGAARRRWETVREAVEIHFPGMRTVYTAAQGHATELCREALEGGSELIISVGGDGTNNEVLCGFVDEQGRNRFPDATLAVLAAGTGGDFQRMFGRARVQRQVERLFTAEPRVIDYGIAHYTDPEGESRMRPFLNVASVGVSGEVVRRVNASNAQLGPTAKYLVGTLQAIRQWRNGQIILSYDEELDAAGEGGLPAGQRIDLTLGIVGNGQYFGAGMWVCPTAEIDDGIFDAIAVVGMSRTKLTATLTKVFKGKHLRVKGVNHRQAKRVGMTPVSDEADIPIEIDGEQVGVLPAQFEIQHHALRVRIG